MHQDLAETLGEFGFDALATREAGTKGWSDAHQLESAAEQGRILVTCNAGDFTLLHEVRVRWTRRWAIPRPPHGGILIVPNGSRAELGEVTRMVADLARGRSAEQVEGRLFKWLGEQGWEERAVPTNR